MCAAFGIIAFVIGARANSTISFQGDFAGNNQGNGAPAEITILKGDGQLTPRSYSLSDFRSVKAWGEMDLVIQKGPSQVTVTTDANLHEALTVAAEGGVLEVGPKNNHQLRATQNLVTITVPTLSGIEYSGVASLTFKDTLTVDQFDLRLDGESTSQLLLQAKQMNIVSAGPSTVVLSGQVDSLDLKLNGSGNVMASGLFTQSVSLASSGNTVTEVNVSDQLNIRGDGEIQVRYRGQPRIKQRCSGEVSLDSF